MIINRNNYETFFLLYVDGELSAAEKNSVDIFLQSNSDLQEEMELLQHAVLQPHAVLFGSKNSLLKKEAGIDAATEEKLLLLLDNELPVNEKTVVEKLIEDNMLVKQAWDVLVKTTLQADTSIVFKHKPSLYKNELGRLVPFAWQRIAAAAVVIGFGIWAGMIYLKNNQRNEPAIAALKKQQEFSTPVNKNGGTKDDMQVVAINEVSAAINKNAIISKTVVQKNIAVAKDKLKGEQPIQNKILAMQKQKKSLQKIQTNIQPFFDNINSIGSNNTDVANVPLSKLQTQIVQAQKNIAPEENFISDKNDAAPNVYAVQTSYNEDNGALDEDEPQKKRSKLAGFLKKMKRVLDRKTNSNQSEKSIKVASLSFAVQ